MSLVVGQRMVRQDDGMRGVVELVDVTASGNYQEPRVVYMDRGEKRIAPKKEKWEVEAPPPRKLRTEEIHYIAHHADRVLAAIDDNAPIKWWEDVRPQHAHDKVLFNLICDYLSKRS